MAIKKVTYKLPLKKRLKNVPEKDRKEVAKEIADFLVDQVLVNTSEAKTSVKGGKWKKKLSPEYKKLKTKLSASPIANMELSGDMLDALESKVSANLEVETGWFDATQAAKADNHNKFSAKSKKTNNPARQAIPNKKAKQTFKPSILKGIERIIKRNEE